MDRLMSNPEALKLLVNAQQVKLLDARSTERYIVTVLTKQGESHDFELPYADFLSVPIEERTDLLHGGPRLERAAKAIASHK